MTGSRELGDGCLGRLGVTGLLTQIKDRNSRSSSEGLKQLNLRIQGKTTPDLRRENDFLPKLKRLTVDVSYCGVTIVQVRQPPSWGI